MNDIDMDLNEDEESDSEKDFKSDKAMPNIWALDHESDNDDKKSKNEQKEDSDYTGATVVHNTNDSDDENSFKDVEKPSFLRRLKKHKDSNNDSNSDKD
jgi:hypothetical protein